MAEVASYLGFSTTKICRLLKTDAIPAAKVGGQYRFVKAAIDRWIGAEASRGAPARDELARWGFRRAGRYWTREELGLAVEVPGSVLAGDEARVTKVEIKGLTIYLIGIEDIIIDRLNACVHWNSLDDGDWAREMAHLNRVDIDWEYLEKRAEAEGVLEPARLLRAKVSDDEDA